MKMRILLFLGIDLATMLLVFGLIEPFVLAFFEAPLNYLKILLFIFTIILLLYILHLYHKSVPMGRIKKAKLSFFSTTAALLTHIYIFPQILDLIN